MTTNFVALGKQTIFLPNAPVLRQIIRVFFYPWEHHLQPPPQELLNAITQKVLRKVLDYSFYQLSEPTQEILMHEILKDCTLEWVHEIDFDTFTEFLFSLLEHFDPRRQKQEYRWTILTLKEHNKQHLLSEGAEAKNALARKEIVEHLFVDNKIDWFLKRVKLI